MILQVSKSLVDAEKFMIENVMSKCKKTGTTIVGIKYIDGVVLCSDTRSTNGPTVADKNCKKIHYISEKIMACGAGTTADTDRVTMMASGTLELYRQKYGEDPFVSHAVRLISDHLFSYGGNIGAALIVGGVDPYNGLSLYSISPDGHMANREYATMGSGSYAATGILESKFRKAMDKQHAIDLGVEAMKAGILNDLFSGSNVDICVIDGNGTEITRSYAVIERKRDPSTILYPKGSIKIQKEDIFKYIEEINQ